MREATAPATSTAPSRAPTRVAKAAAIAASGANKGSGRQSGPASPVEAGPFLSLRGAKRLGNPRALDCFAALAMTAPATGEGITMTNRVWHLKSRPQGLPTGENFELKDLP